MNTEPVLFELVPYLLASFLVTFLGTAAFIKIAPGMGLLDVPNERSAHSTPVPRGAGIVIVLSILGIYLVATYPRPSWALVIAGALTAAVGFLDDLISLPVLPRVIAYLIAAAIIVLPSTAGGEMSALFSDSAIAFITVQLVLIGFVFWCTNAFNFMDGSDGLAGGYAAACGMGWFLLGVIHNEYQAAIVGTLVLGSSGAFLCFNAPPARVFMGDSGSTFLGLVVSTVPFWGLSDGTKSPLFILSAVILLWAFLFDTLWSRTRRAVQVRGFWHPNREHVYQRLLAIGYSPRTVAIAYAAIGAASSLIWVAALVADWPF